MHPPQRRFEVQRERKLNRFARGARGGDDDEAARRAGSDERVVIGREIRIANAAERGVDYR
jgi:hypothetical protein